jgi:hypothetical protein
MSKDADALRELFAVSETGKPHHIRHFLYLPRREDAAAIVDELRRHGYQTEECMAADETNWLVLASHWVVPTEDLMTSTRAFMESLVAGIDGEYDGWEAEVRQDTDPPTRH